MFFREVNIFFLSHLRTLLFFTSNLQTGNPSALGVKFLGHPGPTTVSARCVCDRCWGKEESLASFQSFQSLALTIPETNSSHLKIDGWKMSFLLGCHLFRCYVNFRECNNSLIFPKMALLSIARRNP